MTARFLFLMAFVGLTTSPVVGQFDSGSDGSDGALDCAALLAWGCEGAGCGADCSGCGVDPCTVEIDLGLAATATWNTPSPVAGQGVYDPNEWAVIFKYTTIDIPADVTVEFNNHPKGAPVVWLASGDVTIAGTVRVDGEGGVYLSNQYARPGPGGFSGGIDATQEGPPSAGFGPGGGDTDGGGGYAGPGSGGRIYGSASIFPLIGGSGGSGQVSSSAGQCNGGAGGGALLVASSGGISLTASGAIFANGGTSGCPSNLRTGNGSGGAIRLVANEVFGSGSLQAKSLGNGHPGGIGRIRIEANAISLDRQNISPPASESVPGCVFPDSTAPSLRATLVDGAPVPMDPVATVLSEDVKIASLDPVTLNIEARNVPADTETLIVKVRVVPAHGDAIEVDSTQLQGTFALSTATATVTFPPGHSEVQLRIEFP